ncbi:hypothetical protein B0H14DRAFT_2330840, partial [Mycena olivaceomarginata]
MNYQFRLIILKDRICVDRRKLESYRGWDIKRCAVKSDHHLVITELTSKPDEKPGNGRWSMPKYLLKSRKFMNRVQDLATELVREVKDLNQGDRDPVHNIQTLWEKIKGDVTEHGKHCSRLI